MSRWTFTDPSTSETYTFLVNPNADGSPALRRMLTPFPLTALDGNRVIFEGRQTPTAISWTGVILDEAQYSSVLTWFGHRHQLQLTDDLARTLSIYITDFTAQRAPRRGHLWRLTYTVKAVVLTGTGQNLISAADSEFELGSHSWVYLPNGFTAMSIATVPEWINLGTHSLKLVANALPHDGLAALPLNWIRLGAGPVVKPSTTYRVRLHFEVTPEEQVPGSAGLHGRAVRVYVDWTYTDGAAVVTDLGMFGVANQQASEKVTNPDGSVVSSGPLGGQLLSGSIRSPAMPTGGVTMNAYLQVALVTSPSQKTVIVNGVATLQQMGENDPINVDTLYIDSVWLSQ